MKSPNTKDKHIYFPIEEFELVEKFKRNNHYKSFSEAVCVLVDIGLNASDTNVKLDNILNSIDNNTKKTNTIFLLLKQIYSDMDFPVITDSSKSKQLKIFFDKLKGNKFDD